jgi:hypothetical protein
MSNKNPAKPAPVANAGDSCKTCRVGHYHKFYQALLCDTCGDSAIPKAGA